MKYYGFKGHLLIDRSGVILGMDIAEANVDEREMLLELSEKSGFKTLGDKGYICSERMKEELIQAGVNLHTPIAGQYERRQAKTYRQSYKRHQKNSGDGHRTIE